MIIARELVKAYGDVEVLKGVSVAAKRGEVTCVVGPNGSGKTTLLRILALLESPDAGEVLYDGVAPREPRAIEKIKAAIAYAPQRGHTFSVSVYSNVYLALRSRGVAPREASRRAEEALKNFGLLELRERSAVTLSGGQKQLLSVARALALEPEYLFLDEPTAGLDPERAEFVVKRVKEYARERGAVAVIVSHNIKEVSEAADRIFVLLDGRVVSELTGPQEVSEVMKWMVYK